MGFLDERIIPALEQVVAGEMRIVMIEPTITGEIPAEIKEVVLGMFRSLTEHDFNCQGEFCAASGVPIRWEYNQGSRVMRVSIPNTAGSVCTIARAADKEVRHYQDPDKRHIHAALRDSTDFKLWVAACGRIVGLKWDRTNFTSVTCPNCIKAIEG